MISGKLVETFCNVNVTQMFLATRLCVIWKTNFLLLLLLLMGWNGGATGRALDLRSTGREYKSYSGKAA